MTNESEVFETLSSTTSRLANLNNAPKVGCDDVLAAFATQHELTTKDLYQQLSLDLDLSPTYAAEKKAIGKSGSLHNVFNRRVRWHVQTLKRLGAIEQMDRGKWRLAGSAKDVLTEAPRKQVLVAFSTDLGIGLWANSEDVFSALQENIALSFSSPPYPLARERQYGNIDQTKYVDWLCTMVEPIVKNLIPGGSIVLNLTNDIFETGLPSRSLYLERVTLAFCDRLGLSLMDRFVWENPCKPPGPFQWASKNRFQCNTGYEPVLWFTNDPAKVRSNNRRVLEPHTQTQQKLIAAGGEQRTATYSGGAYRVHQGSFGNPTEGRIPRNILRIPHSCPDQKPAREFANLHGIPAHPAPMPKKLSDFFVEFLTQPGDLVVDQFGGIGTTARSAETKGRRWVIVERCREYIAAAAERFRDCSGFTAAE